MKTPGIIFSVSLIIAACGRPAGQAVAEPRPVVVADTILLPDYDAQVQVLREKYPDSFTILIEKPFIVIGDEPAGVVGIRAENTVKWAVAMLKKDFFDRDPADIIDIWLFRDDSSYYRHCRRLFGTEPTTPFGFYLESDKVLLMNISTGGGTLVHEIVHPFVASNFPDCPSWFNEGLASLYEQCGERDGHIVGYTNWRLKGLQEAIRSGLVGSFADLCVIDPVKFYTEERGINYGQARYLCYYLQEKGWLTKFYKEFLANRKDDPTGYKSLKKILGDPDMDEFKKEWEAYVLGLTYP
jgi:hypothetical protein